MSYRNAARQSFQPLNSVLLLLLQLNTDEDGAWTVWVMGGDRASGRLANTVLLVIYGDNGKSGELRLADGQLCNDQRPANEFEVKWPVTQWYERHGRVSSRQNLGCRNTFGKFFLVGKISSKIAMFEAKTFILKKSRGNIEILNTVSKICSCLPESYEKFVVSVRKLQLPVPPTMPPKMAEHYWSLYRCLLLCFLLINNRTVADNNNDKNHQNNSATR